MQNPALWVRVSLSNEHRTVTAVAAARAGWTVLHGHPAVDSKGRPLPPKPRVEIVAATPNPTDPEAVSGDTPEE